MPQSPAQAERRNTYEVDDGHGNIIEIDSLDAPTDAEIQAAFKAVGLGPKGPASHKNDIPRGGAADSSMGDYFKENPDAAKRVLPMAAGLGASLLAGPEVGIPLGMALQGGAAGATSLATGNSPVQAVWDTATNAIPAGLQKIGALKGPVQGLARRAWQYAAGGGTPRAAETILQAGRGTLTRGNLDGLTADLQAGATGGKTASGATIRLKPAVIQEAGDAMTRGVQRAGRTNHLTPMDYAVGAAGWLGGPKGAALAGGLKAIAKPLPASFLAQKTYQMGSMAPAIANVSPDLVRAAVLAKILGDNQP